MSLLFVHSSKVEAYTAEIRYPDSLRRENLTTKKPTASTMCIILPDETANIWLWFGVSTECKASSSLTCLSQKCPFPQLLILARGCWMELASHPPPTPPHTLRTVCALSSRDRHTFRYTHTTPKNPQTTAVHSGRWILLLKTDDNGHAYLHLKNLITGSMQPCPTNLVNMSLRSKKTTSNNITNYSLCQSITKI